MKELKYPFDSSYILQNKKRIKRILIENHKEMTKKKIAILGGSTTSNITQVLELFLLDNNIVPEFYESEYNKYYEDAIFGNDNLDHFNPDIIYIYTTNRNIDKFPSILDSNEEIKNFENAQYDKFKSIWKSLTEKFNVPIIQNNFEPYFYRLLGNKDISDVHGKNNFINKLNNRFYEYANEHNNFYICDLNYIAADFGLKKWSNPYYYYLYKYAMCIEAIPYLSFNVSNIIKSIFGKNKKGFVVDLDNTLWGGVIGDDGLEGITLGEEVSTGEAFIEFQKYLKEYKDLGILLNIDSKNDEKNALLGLTHPNSVLRANDFIDIKANWETKDKNFNSIATDLNLSPESLLFIDDNPAERHIVTSQIKGVVSPEIGESYDYIQNIDRGGYFEVTTISRDDSKRNDMYKENIERNKFQESFKDYSEYLKSLGMIARISEFEMIHISRITQLTNKSNQFNLTTRRYTQNELETITKDSNYITLYGQLTDRFGDNGIVSLIVGKKEDRVCDIELWLMSCRVLKRDMEYAMMDKLVDVCIKNDILKIIGHYYPTGKNMMVKDFYEELGFVKVYEEECGNKKYELELQKKYLKKNKVIKVV